MFYLFFIFLLLLPIYSNIINYFNKNKFYTYQMLLAGLFAPLVILMSCLTTTLIATKTLIEVVGDFYILLCIVSIISHISYTLIRNRYRFKDLIYFQLKSWNVLIYLISVIFLLLFISFSNFSDHDASFYINISSYFSNNQYSTDGISILETKFYLSPSMYYLVGACFENEIMIFYKLVNPIIFFIIVNDIKDVIIDKFVLKNKWNNIWSFVLTASIALLTLSQINYLIGMNIVMQSFIIVVIIVSVVKEKNNLWLNFLCMISFSFFSSTGIITSLIGSVSLIIYYLVTVGWKKSLINLPFISLIVLWSFFIFTNIDISGINIKSILFIILNYLIIGLQLSLLLLDKYKFKLEIKTNFENVFSKKWLSIIFCASWILLSIFQVFFFIFVYELLYTVWQLVFVTFAFNIIVSSLILYRVLKNKKFDALFLLIFLLEFISIMLLIFQKIIPQFSDNQSAWRSIYLNIGMGNMTDIFMLLIFFTYTYISKIKKEKFNTYFIYIKKFIMPILVFISAFFSMLNVYSNIFGYQDKVTNVPVKVSINTMFNLKNLSSNEISAIKEINTSNYEFSYMSDIQLSPYLNKLSDVTSALLVKDNNSLASYKWNFNNWINGIVEWNSKHPDSKVDTTPNSIANILNDAINNFPSLNIKSISGNILSKVNYIILRNDSTYYNDCSQTLISSGFNVSKYDNITIFEVM